MMIHIRNWVHERNVNFDGLGNEVLNFAKHLQIILGLDVFRVGRVETSNETTKRCDTDTLTDTKNGCNNI